MGFTSFYPSYAGLKAPGTFWTAVLGECFLFLRSQLLSGRWEVMLDNLTRQTATDVHLRKSNFSITRGSFIETK
jgi:hypothetical protein